MPRTYKKKPPVEKTARKYPCGCIVRSVSPAVDMRACRKHHIALASGSVRTYEQAVKFVECLGSEYRMVAPPQVRGK